MTLINVEGFAAKGTMWKVLAYRLRFRHRSYFSRLMADKQPKFAKSLQTAFSRAGGTEGDTNLRYFVITLAWLGDCFS